MTYRNQTQIVTQGLDIVNESDRHGVQITKLCHKANIAHPRLKKMLDTLTSSGLMNEIEYDGKNTFVITSSGKIFLEEYKHFSDIVESFGLEM